jgi:gas vesicle protein
MELPIPFFSVWSHGQVHLKTVSVSGFFITVFSTVFRKIVIFADLKQKYRVRKKGRVLLLDDPFFACIRPLNYLIVRKGDLLMPIITVEKPLKDKLGDEAVDSLIRLINQTQTEQKAELLEFVEEKFEHRLTLEIGKVNERLTEEIGKVNERLTEEIGKVNKRLTEEIGKVNERLTEEIGNVNERITQETSKLDVKIESTRADLIKWMFIFWIGQVAALLGILFAFFK